MKKSTLKGILTAIAAVVLIVGGIIVASQLEKKSEKAPEGAGTSTISTVRQEEEAGAEVMDYEAEEPTVFIGGKEYRYNKNISTLLMIGVDDMELEESIGYQNDALADFLVLAIFNNENETCTLLQINRNTIADVPVLGALGDYIGITTEPICYAHTYGKGKEDSCENTVMAVSRMLYNVPIDNYIALTMASIAKINDVVGGVTVKIEDDFTGVDDTLVKGQTVTLRGEHAMNFVRSRMTMKDDAGNAARMRRQATYMTALVSKLREKLSEDDAFVLELYDAVADYLVTDYDINGLNGLAMSMEDYALGDIVTPEGENVVKEHEEFYLDDEALQEMIADLFYIPVEE